MKRKFLMLILNCNQQYLLMFIKLNEKEYKIKGFIAFSFLIISLSIIMVIHMKDYSYNYKNPENLLNIKKGRGEKNLQKQTKIIVLQQNSIQNSKQMTHQSVESDFDGLFYLLLQDWGQIQQLEHQQNSEQSGLQQHKNTYEQIQYKNLLSQEQNYYIQIKSNEKTSLQNPQESGIQFKKQESSDLVINGQPFQNSQGRIPQTSFFSSSGYSFQSFGAAPVPNLQKKQVQNQQTPNMNLPQHGISQLQINNAVSYIQLKNLGLDSELALLQKRYYEEKYKISQYQQMPFCIVVPSYNNFEGQRALNNIKSILQQDYQNFHVVFIDDSSTDGTGQIISQYAKDNQISQEKLKIILNKGRSMAMPNIYRAAKEFCKSFQIFMIVDGDDQLIGKQVFKHFNAMFQKQDVWLVYSNFISLVSHTVGYSRPYLYQIVQQNAFRANAFTLSHLRAFYTKLLWLVREEDLKDQNGDWFRAANDVAIYTPILQMVHKKLRYSNQISYLYNFNTGLNNHLTKSEQQKQNQKKVKQKSPYIPVQQLFTLQQKQDLKNQMKKHMK